MPVRVIPPGSTVQHSRRGWRCPEVPIEQHNVNDYTMRDDQLVHLVKAYFNTNIADGPAMMITEKEAAALVDLIVAEL